MQEFVNVNWDIFSAEEQEKMKALIVIGEPERLALVVDEMTKEKENEVQKIRDQITPLVQDERSKIITEFWKKHPDGPQSPAEEKELQGLIDAEAAEEKRKKMAKIQPVVEPVVEELPVVEPVEESTVEAEEKEEDKPRKKSKK